MENKLIFDRKRNRVKHCPCGKSNDDGKFAPFLDHEKYGHCHACGMSFLPENDLHLVSRFPTLREKKQETEKPIDFLTPEEFLQYLEANGNLNEYNAFLRWLVRPERGKYAFPVKVAHKLIRDYCITNYSPAPGSTIFPYIDICYRVRDLKLMEYDEYTGKRKREGGKCFYVINKFLKKESPNTSRCFFGEHQLAGNRKPVKIFESEATAVYAAAFYPESVCLATGGKHGCKWSNRAITAVLKGRDVTLYPDLDGYQEWQQMAKAMASQGIKVTVSDLLQRAAQNFAKTSGISLADLIAQKYDLRDVLKYRVLPDIQF